MVHFYVMLMGVPLVTQSRVNGNAGPISLIIFKLLSGDGSYERLIRKIGNLNSPACKVAGDV